MTREDVVRRLMELAVELNSNVPDLESVHDALIDLSNDVAAIIRDEDN